KIGAPKGMCLVPDAPDPDVEPYLAIEYWQDPKSWSGWRNGVDPSTWNGDAGTIEARVKLVSEFGSWSVAQGMSASSRFNEPIERTKQRFFQFLQLKWREMDRALAQIFSGALGAESADTKVGRQERMDRWQTAASDAIIQVKRMRPDR